MSDLPTPRVASSIGDLRIGQWVAWFEGGEWQSAEVEPSSCGHEGVEWEFTGTEVILSDPPPEPVTVSAKAWAVFEQLERATNAGRGSEVIGLAHDLVFEVRRADR